MVDTSVANTQRWREWRAKNPKNKDTYPNVATFLKDFPTPANQAANTRKANTNKNYVASANTEALKEEVENFKTLLQRQIENAGELNMNETTRKRIQDNIETTRSLIESRQQEVESREAKEDLKAANEGLNTVKNVINVAPINNANRQARRNLTRKAMNALDRMKGVNGLEGKIVDLKKMIDECCKDSSNTRGRSGSISSSVGTNNRAAENNKQTFTNYSSNTTNKAANLFEPSPKMPNTPYVAPKLLQNKEVNTPISQREKRAANARAIAAKGGTDQEFFNLKNGFTKEDLRKAYLDLELLHPNKGGTTQEFQNVQARYERLMERFKGEKENPFDEYNLNDLEALVGLNNQNIASIGSRTQLQDAIEKKKNTVNLETYEDKKNNTNGSPERLFGNQSNFEKKNNTKKSLTMNNLTADEKERVRLFKELNTSISNTNALNLIKNERSQSATRAAKKGGKRRVTRKGRKNRKNRKNRK